MGGKPDPKKVEPELTEEQKEALAEKEREKNSKIKNKDLQSLKKMDAFTRMVDNYGQNAFTQKTL